MAVVVEVIQNDGVDVEVAGERYSAPGGGDTPVVSGGVQSVNFIKPDENGNVNVLGWHDPGWEKEYTFDGNPAGKEEFQDGPFTLVKVSSDVPSREDLIGATLVVTFVEDNGYSESRSLVIDESVIQGDDTTYGPMPYMMVIAKEMDVGGTILDPGIYMVLAEEEDAIIYASSLAISKAPTTHRIDPEFLPEGTGWVETIPKRTVRFSGHLEDYDEYHEVFDNEFRVKVSDNITGLRYPFGFDAREPVPDDMANGLYDVLSRIEGYALFGDMTEGAVYTYDIYPAEGPLYTVSMGNEDNTVAFSVVLAETPDPDREGVVYTPGIWFHVTYMYGSNDYSIDSVLDALQALTIPEGRVYHQIPYALSESKGGQDQITEEEIVYRWDGNLETADKILVTDTEYRKEYLVRVGDVDPDFDTSAFQGGTMEITARLTGEDGTTTTETIPYAIWEAKSLPELGVGIAQSALLYIMVIYSATAALSLFGVENIDPGIYFIYAANDTQEAFASSVRIPAGAITHRKPVPLANIPLEARNKVFTTAIEMHSDAEKQENGRYPATCLSSYKEIVELMDGAERGGVAYYGYQVMFAQYPLDFVGWTSDVVNGTMVEGYAFWGIVRNGGGVFYDEDITDGALMEITVYLWDDGRCEVECREINTGADIDSIVEAVINALPTAEGGSF